MAAALIKSRKFLAALAILFVCTCLVMVGVPLPAGGFFWFAALYLIWSEAAGQEQQLDPDGAKSHLLLIAATGAVLIARLLNIDTINLHRDEFIEAYFSRAFDLLTTDFFAPVPNPPAWVAQFPSFFFFLQKLVLSLIGYGIYAVKVSTLPFVLIECWALFRLGRIVLGDRYATLPVWILAFFSPALYFETYATHIEASTAFFTLFLSYLIEALQLRSERAALRSGVLLCICLLNYPSSYLAFPVAGLITLIALFQSRSLQPLKIILPCMFAFAVLLSPFAAYWIKNEFYLGARIQQVNLISGSWSEQASRIKQGESTLKVMAANLGAALRSLYQPGVGGAEDYNFGQQNLLTSLNAGLLLIGVVLIVWNDWRRLSSWAVLCSLLLAFIIGMGLTKPPPAFHRFTVAFPLICLIIAYPLQYLARSNLSKLIRCASITALAGFLALTNLSHFMTMRLADQQRGFDIDDDIKVITFIDQHLPAGIPVTIAGYPTLALEFIFPFFGTERAVETRYHNDLLRDLDRSRPYIIAVLCNEQFCETFAQADPAGRLIDIGSLRFKIFTNVQSS